MINYPKVDEKTDALLDLPRVWKHSETGLHEWIHAFSCNNNDLVLLLLDDLQLSATLIVWSVLIFFFPLHASQLPTSCIPK